jgi:hypothetical protein
MSATSRPKAKRFGVLETVVALLSIYARAAIEIAKAVSPR